MLYAFMIDSPATTRFRWPWQQPAELHWLAAVVADDAVAVGWLHYLHGMRQLLHWAQVPTAGSTHGEALQQALQQLQAAEGQALPRALHVYILPPLLLQAGATHSRTAAAPADTGEVRTIDRKLRHEAIDALLAETNVPPEQLVVLATPAPQLVPHAQADGPADAPLAYTAGTAGLGSVVASAAAVPAALALALEQAAEAAGVRVRSMQPLPALAPRDDLGAAYLIVALGDSATSVQAVAGAQVRQLGQVHLGLADMAGTRGAQLWQHALHELLGEPGWAGPLPVFPGGATAAEAADEEANADSATAMSDTAPTEERTQEVNVNNKSDQQEVKEEVEATTVSPALAADSAETTTEEGITNDDAPAPTMPDATADTAASTQGITTAETTAEASTASPAIAGLQAAPAPTAAPRPALRQVWPGVPLAPLAVYLLPTGTQQATQALPLLGATLAQLQWPALPLYRLLTPGSTAARCPRGSLPCGPAQLLLAVPVPA